MLQDFIANLKNDNLVSPSRFRVYITGNLNDVASATYDIMLNCASVSIPALNIVTTGDKRVGLGQTQNFAAGKELTPIVMTFYESESFKERKFFSDWIDNIYNKTTKRFNFFKNYSKIVTIEQLSKDGRVIYQCKLIDAFPTNVSEMSRSYAAMDTYEQFSVNMNYNEIQEIFYNKSGQPILPEAELVGDIELL